jgi:D-alanyl-D-alanine carboxypeptidase
MSQVEAAQIASNSNTVSSDLASQLQASLDRAVRETGIPGATAYIDSPQGTWFGASGVSNLETNTPMQPDEIFAIASATKAFTGATLLKLQEQGKLNLDDPLSQWLPEIAAQIPDGNSITIRQLLNGSAGVYNYTDDERFVAEVFANPQRDWQPEELIAYIDGKPRFQRDQCTPQWCYPNTGMVLAAMAAEKATGESFSRLLRHQILNPLGLDRTFFEDEPIVGNLARGYQDVLKADGIPDDLTDLNRSAFWANGGLFSNVTDQAKFSEALFGGKLLQPQSLQEMLTFVNNTGWGDDFKYGLGTFERSTPWGRVLGHGGDDPGYQAGRFYFPDRDITAVYLINRQYEIENPEKDAATPVFSAIMTPLVAQGQGNNPKSVPESSGVIGLIVLGATGLLLGSKHSKTPEEMSRRQAQP